MGAVVSPSSSTLGVLCFLQLLFDNEDGGRTFLRNVDKHLPYYVRFEVFTAVTMKNVVFCDTETHFVPLRRHITSALQGPAI
jgi:hypothetical protein